MGICGQKFKIKEVALKEKSKTFIKSLLKLREEYSTFDNKKG